MAKQRRVKTVDPVELKLCAAFSANMNVIEACRYAGISKQAFYKRYPKGSGSTPRHPFHDRIDQLRSTPSMYAKQALEKALKLAAETGTENLDLALKYLERVNRDEFSLRSEHVGNAAAPPLIIQINGVSPKGLLSDDYPRTVPGRTVEPPPIGADTGTGDRSSDA